jgi:hypothetical protein
MTLNKWEFDPNNEIQTAARAQPVASYRGRFSATQTPEIFSVVEEQLICGTTSAGQIAIPSSFVLLPVARHA